MENEWKKVCEAISEQFAHGDVVDVQSILFLIGVDQLGKGYGSFSKDDKVDIMHIATCKLLSYWGYYKYAGCDSDGWPQWELQHNVPMMTTMEEEKLIKRSIIKYMKEEKGII